MLEAFRSNRQLMKQKTSWSKMATDLEEEMDLSIDCMPLVS